MSGWGPLRPSFASIECGDRANVLEVKREVEDLKVLLHARGRHRLGEHYSLSTRSAIWVMVGSSSTPPRGDWRPRLGGDPVLSVVGAYCLIGEVGVHVDLVYHRHHVGLCDQLLQVLDLEVRYADRASPTVALDFLESLVAGAGQRFSSPLVGFLQSDCLSSTLVIERALSARLAQMTIKSS